MNWMTSSYKIQKAQIILEETTHLEIRFWISDAEVNDTIICFWLDHPPFGAIS
jgi:hypothetical protein